MRVTPLVCAFVVLSSVVSQGAACNARDAARKLFTDQGLHVLTPARSYIEVGGLVVVPAKGSPYYVDRLAQMPSGSEDKPVDFAAILLKESQGSTSSLGVAIPAVQSVIPVPLSAKYDATQSVALSQIDAAGTRLRIPTAQSFIQLPAPKKWIQMELGNKGRAFIVYEVYRAKSLTLKAENNAAIDVGLKVGESTPATAKPAGGDDAAKQDASGAGGKWTRTTTYELSLQSDTSLPFAVRIAEIVAGKNGLELRPGSFKFKGGLAAGGDVERFTAVIDPAAPELALSRRTP